MARNKQSEPGGSDPKPAKSQQVRALVLSDCVYGKCGEVKSFEEVEAKAIEAAGYIDTHPNAVKSVKV